MLLFESGCKGTAFFLHDQIICKKNVILYAFLAFLRTTSDNLIPFSNNLDSYRAIFSSPSIVLKIYEK